MTQIMCEYGLWDLVHDVAYKENLEDKVIDESEEHILNIDNTHLRGYSTPGKYVKECRECELAEDCEDKVSTWIQDIKLEALPKGAERWI